MSNSARSSILSSSVQSEVWNEHEGCRLCWALSPAGQRFPANYVLRDLGDFLAVPAVGALMPGYHLLVSKQHKGSVATLDDASLIHLASVIEEHVLSLRSVAPSWIVFEHGSLGLGAGQGCCIDHFHLHFVPLNLDLTALVTEKVRSCALRLAHISGIRSVVRTQGSGYLLIRNPDGSMAVFLPEAFPSQFIRQIIATHLRLAENWDWKISSRDEVNYATIRLFREAGLTQRQIYYAHAIEERQLVDLVADIDRTRDIMVSDALDAKLVSMFELIESASNGQAFSPLELVEIEVQNLAASDLVIVDLSTHAWQYTGSIMEIIYAKLLDLPIIAITGSSSIAKRKWLQAHVDYHVETAVDARAIVRNLLGDSKKSLQQHQPPPVSLKKLVTYLAKEEI